jgi:hypothetical protein
LLREIERGDITDEKIEQAWNEYQLARALRQAYYERERFRSLSSELKGQSPLSSELKRLVRALTAIEKGQFTQRERAPNKTSDERRAGR